MKKRKPKLGYFYILKAKYNGEYIYKFGATTNLKNRRRALKYDYNLDFKTVCAYLCKDVYGVENSFKWELWNCDWSITPYMGGKINNKKRYELFALNNGDNDEYVKCIFKTASDKFLRFGV